MSDCRGSLGSRLHSLRSSIATRSDGIADIRANPPPRKTSNRPHNTRCPGPVDCTSSIFDYMCSSGYAQRIVDIASGCRDGTYPRGIAAACAVSETSGDFCGTAAVRFLLTVAHAADPSNCPPRVLAAGSCPSGCRSFLESARSTLGGCCINTYINTTLNPVIATIYSTVLDYRLWNVCNVSLPAADCGNGLTIGNTLQGA